MKTLNFKTKERDPKKINIELCKKLKLPIIVTKHKPKDEVFTELNTNQEPVKKVCGLIHMHRDKALRPEERLFITDPVKVVSQKVRR